MLRITGLSLLLGALALIAGLTLFFSPPGDTESPAPVINVNSADTRIFWGTATTVDDELQLQLNAAGNGVIRLATKRIDARAYPFLHLAIEESAHKPQVSISWITSGKPADVHTYVPHSKSWSSLWLATNEIPEWTGNIGFVRLNVVGQAGETVRIRDFGIYPASPARQLKAIFSDLAGYVPWNRAAMNSHTGVTPVASFYPSMLTVALLALSLLVYSVLLLVFRSRVTFSWHVVALIFLACWIILDLFWQNRLLRQVADTYHTFSGKNVEEKLTVGPDAELYKFVAQVKPLAQRPETRIFVSSSDRYRGQRSAYYLYPLNIYWLVPDSEFPPDDLLHSGDLIVLINPTPMRFNEERQTLATSPVNRLDAELLLNDRIGTVVRLK